MRVLLAPGGQRGEQTAIDVRRISAGVAAHFLEVDGAQAADVGHQLVEPTAEAQVAHSAAVVAARPERHRAAGDRAVAGAQRPAGGGAEIEREDRAVDRAQRLCSPRRLPWRQAKSRVVEAMMVSVRGLSWSGRRRLVLGGAGRRRPALRDGACRAAPVARAEGAHHSTSFSQAGGSGIGECPGMTFTGTFIARNCGFAGSGECGECCECFSGLLYRVRARARTRVRIGKTFTTFTDAPSISH